MRKSQKNYTGIMGSLSGNINLNSAGCQFLSPYKDLGRTDGENTILGCIKRISNRYGRR